MVADGVHARLLSVQVPRAPVGSVLVLHGGGGRDDGAAVSRLQPSVLRMVPVAWRLARVGRRRLAVYRLLNSQRGWDDGLSPLDDVRWALDQLRERHGDHPVGLVGHSLGGRAALLAAGEPGVESVVALAPWVYANDGARVDPTGRRILVVHGTADRVSSLARTERVVDTLRQSARTGLVLVADGTHGMLRRRGEFEGLTADFVAATMLDRPAREAAVRDVLRGASRVAV
ncbi:alpha/beta fold hydrolase [Mumia quercus]|uniref:alpha/beta fold hydrolase n=1 Tax=Mumia quercus TaxID=2976125 RepID=UPI0021D2673F|nr:alpha/beta fold hydrolase [Mumia quercus]